VISNEHSGGVEGQQHSVAAFDRVCRAQSLLGTIVAIRIGNVERREAEHAISRGFGAAAEVQRLMSFHDATSDVARLNREALARAVRVDPLTMEVLRLAVQISAVSAGCFDISVADQLVAGDKLPRPLGCVSPDPGSSWRDIELLDDNRVRFHRPLWIDLGGIAKGFAVDYAFKSMSLSPAVQACVNAGGDLRVQGPAAESIALRVATSDGLMPVVQLRDGSLASSSGLEHDLTEQGAHMGNHIHGLTRTTMGQRTFVSVIAQECVLADALTKAVMALGVTAGQILRGLGATAFLYEDSECHVIGAGA
jgi:thiamine biosynthesis lipoprotein